MIPVFSPEITLDDIKSVTNALTLGEISGNFGESIKMFEEQFANFSEVEHAITVSSGTAALHLAIAALNLEKGSEVLISSSTNIATALAVVHNGLIPVPIDSDIETWNLNIDLVETAITSKTRAIIPVHLYGNPVNMPYLMNLAKKYNLYVIEDCAESHGATINGQMTGSFGHVSCFSFYANKILTTGEGGMVVTNNKEIADRIKLLKNLGFTEPRFKHDLLGYNFRMTGYQAALGLSQLKRVDHIVSEKIRVGETYEKYLSNTPQISTQKLTPNSKHVYWMFGVLVNNYSKVDRDQLITALYKNGVETRTFFCPMDMQPALKDLFGMSECPVAGNLWANGLYLPSAHTLTEQQIRTISEIIIQNVV